MNELKGVVSKLDITLYDIKENINFGSHIFFSQSSSAVGKHRAILAQPNTIPSNWKSFTINAIGVKVFASDFSSFMSFISNSHYTFKIADYEVKSGHISDFFNISTMSYYAIQHRIGNNNLVIFYPFQLDMPRNLYLNLMKPIIIEPLVNFQFIINVETHLEVDAKVGVYFKGILDRGIVG
ncbi:MAG: hypothetical protein RMJ67_06065 [Elusimicrobiota bacterium]|nr:hypothetical protein [Endomicrobiia bacterium]MDW8166058.1 hypothetical protein [Elusimicrobiota bacterium]